MPPRNQGTNADKSEEPKGSEDVAATTDTPEDDSLLGYEKAEAAEAAKAAAEAAEAGLPYVKNSQVWTYQSRRWPIGSIVQLKNAGDYDPKIHTIVPKVDVESAQKAAQEAAAAKAELEAAAKAPVE